MKKSFIVCVLALCLLSALLAPAQAEFYVQVFNTESLNIRSGPGVEYAWLGSIPRDGQVRVVSESNGWYQIVTLDGSITGYMSKNYLMPVTSPSYEEYQTPSSVAQGYATVTGTDSLNVRTGPGTEHSWVGSVARGETVMVNGTIGNWYLVFVPSKGLNGYVSANFISFGGAQPSYGGNQPVTGGTTAYVSNPAGTRFLNLREYPSYDSNILDIFYNGETCTVLSRQQDGWVYVSAIKNGVRLYGYFRGEYLSSYPVPSGQVSPAQGSPIGTATVNTRLNGGNGKSLNLRSEPSLNASILLHIPNGSTLQVYRKGSIWWQVSYNGFIGYVDSSFIGSGYTPAQPTGGNAYVRTGNGGKLNLREQANANSRVLGQYENGTAVNVIQRGTTWCYVQVGGQSGYMMTQYLSITGGGSSATKLVVNSNGGSYVNLRTSPDKNNNVNMRVPVGSTVTVLSWGQEWAQVSYGGVSGYMMTWFLK